MEGIIQFVENGLRCILDIHSNEKRVLELISSNEKNMLQVGKYSFDKTVFEWAKICLLASAKKNPEWLIIDEIGKLELDNKGLEPAVGYILNEPSIRDKTKIILVVRTSLVNQVIEKYNLSRQNYKNFEL